MFERIQGDNHHKCKCQVGRVAKKKRVESLQSEWWRCRKVVRLLQVRELNERIYCIVFETVQRRWRM